MLDKTDAAHKLWQTPNLGEQTEAGLALQRELLEICEQASRVWLDRVKSEVDLWSGLAATLAATRSVPEIMGACQNCVAERMQMTAEDGKRLFDDSQKITQIIARSLTRTTEGMSERNASIRFRLDQIAQCLVHIQEHLSQIAL